MGKGNKERDRRKRMGMERRRKRGEKVRK